MSVELSRGSPTFCNLPHVRFQLGVELLAPRPRTTRRRDPAQHTWPRLNQMASTTPSTAPSRSASPKTMNGDLPPSSSDSFLPVPALASRSGVPPPSTR